MKNTKTKFLYLLIIILINFLFQTKHALAQAPNNSKLVTKQEWIDFVKANAKPINLDSTGDYYDLHFLKTILKDKRIVMLGESSHDTKEFTEIKIRIIKFLHEQMGFNVIALESDLDLLEANSSLSPLNLMTQYMSDSRVLYSGNARVI